jgi:hypothetical protein
MSIATSNVNVIHWPDLFDVTFAQSTVERHLGHFRAPSPLFPRGSRNVLPPAVRPENQPPTGANWGPVHNLVIEADGMDMRCAGGTVSLHQ